MKSKKTSSMGLIETKARIISSASVVGRSEHDGPLGNLFDLHDDTDRFGQKTWEQSESEMQRRALSIAMKKKAIRTDDIGALFAGDLLNQCVGSAYGLTEYTVPYFGLYGACSTSAEGLTLAAMTVNRKCFDVAAAVTSSHNCAAERQFRTPIEYGGQRPPSAQWTVTGAGAFIVAADSDDSPFISSDDPYICHVMPGIVTDVSAMDVARMTLRRGPQANTRSCSSFGSEPWSDSTAADGATARTDSMARRISPSPGRKQRTSPSVSASARPTAAATDTAPR